MNLRKKKELAARTLNVGKDRIIFLESRLNEIKEAITKQDIRDLKQEGVILVKEKRGRRKNVGRKRARKTGKIKKKVDKSKRDYISLTRKLRRYTSELKKQERLSPEKIKELRKKIRNSEFKSKANLKFTVEGIKK